MHEKANRLINEKSPYLLQHAYNPVDWYPWGEEAFAKAKAEDKPIFLSIGYSTCHWCHVMGRESFEDEETAEVLNDTFVCIKVDREERPDIDSVYMSVCQMMTGSGGWPLTIIMTGDKKPFFAATYLPKQSMGGKLGVIDLSLKMRKLWEENRSEILSAASSVSNKLKELNPKNSEKDIGENEIKNAFSEFSYIFDDEYGGFGSSPKFPSPHSLMFLLRYYKFYNDKLALKMVEKTLNKMANGG
ncbi:MAG TPA: thioredoxin domain-containing protein, partial [Clostridiaceae bacterium]|nr:thioredoxin domain-containing protein [Clostridiaceae bacterium]